MRISGACAVLALLATIGLSACSGSGGDVSLVTGDECAGFTPAGARIHDKKLIETVVKEWAEPDDNERLEPLPGKAVCVVYAGTDELGYPHVALIADGRLVTYEGLEEDDATIGHFTSDSFVGHGAEDDVPVIGVGDRKVLLSQEVRSATAYTPKPAELDPTKRLIDLGDPGRVLVVTTARGRYTAEPTTYVAAAADRSDDRIDAVPVEDGPLPLGTLLRLDGAVPVLGSAVRHARGESRYRPARLELVATTQVATGPVLLANAIQDPFSSRLARPFVSLNHEVKHDSGQVETTPYVVGIGSVDPGPGWASGFFLRDAAERPYAYLAAAEPRKDSAGPVTLDIAVGNLRYRRSGPLTWVPVPATTTAGALIGTGADGLVVPTQQNDIAER